MPDLEEGVAVASEDTSVSTEQTSTDSPASDTSLEDMEIEDSEIEEDDSTDESDETLEVDEQPTEDEDSTEVVDDETEEDTPSEPVIDTKKFNDEMAKRRIAERQLREERNAREQEKLTAYLRDAEDDETELANRKLEVDAYLIQKEKANLNYEKLQVGIDKSLAGIDLFRTGTPEVKEALLEALDDFEAMYVTKDAAGNPVEIKADVYQYLTAKADSIRKLTGVGARQQEKSKAFQQNRTVPLPVRTPKEPKVDPDLADFDKGWD